MVSGKQVLMMFETSKSIKSLYAINLIEGEGVGTAYEYYSKLRKLRKFINSIGSPRRILIAGLPEKYGLSMDFFLLGQMLQAETVVIDERANALERARSALSILRNKKLLGDVNTVLLKSDQIENFNNEGLFDGEFDLALSSEVLQRLDTARRHTFISNLKFTAKNFAIFVPNSGNESHANLSGLNSISLRELLKYIGNEHSDSGIYDYGYIDMPPFPPGLSRSQDKREQAAESRLESSLMKGLEIYSLCENLIPKFIKEKIAHIVYIMVKNH
jgi:hypothetical protein